MARTGKVIIAKNIKLDKSYKDVLSYNETQMLALVNSNKVAEKEHCSFLEPGKNIIDTGFSYSDSLKCNYMALQNPNYSNKWFFCFIDKVEFINPNTTRIHYTIDEFSTWFDYWEVSNCFVIREHVNSDNVGEHTVPENLELGDYKINAHLRDSNLRTTKIVIASTISPSDYVALIGGTYNGIYSGEGYYTYDAASVTSLLTAMSGQAGNKIDAVSSIFLCPSFLLPQPGGGSVSPSNSPSTYDLGVSPITTLDGYTPKNKKLLTHPFCYILATNGNNQSAVFKQELFTNMVNDEYVFRVFGCLTPGASIRCVPINYNGSEVNTDAGINLGKYPQCNWATDQFTNWITQNGVNVATTTGLGVGKIAAGIATDNPAAVLSGTISVANSVNQIYQASEMPPQLHGNTNCGDVITAMGENTFHFYRMTIKAEYARICDDFLSKFGYKINRIKTPNQTGRTYWNYVQIGEEENIGYSTISNKSTPASSMEIINNIYRRGVTIWHSHDNLGNYSLNNTIVS